MRLLYCGLEKYVERYSFQLEDWNTREFNRLGVDYTIVNGQNLDNSQAIKTGSVLDAHGRTYWSATQTGELVRHLASGVYTSSDVVFYEDMFTPGLESLGYIHDQVKDFPRVFVRCLAQTVDPDDFVHRTGMFDWMRPFEQMVDAICSKTGGGILVASEELVAHLRICGFKSSIYVTGLPFGKAEVLERGAPRRWDQREQQVVFAARWDDEKQPLFFEKVVKEVRSVLPETKFKILSGANPLRSNNPELLEIPGRANIEVLAGLSKDQYYEELSKSKVLFNCALQDWVSNTVSEADALGCMTVYPAYRSFPEVFANNPDHMYLPWSVQDAAGKVLRYLQADRPPLSLGRVSDYQDRTIERTIQVFTGQGEQYRRGEDYRKVVADEKY